MAKKASSPGYKEILSDINKGHFAPVYLLMGEEDYYIDKLSEALEKNVIPEEDRDFNFNTYYGADSEVKQVIASAQQLPLMSDRQLVMLKESQAMEKAKSQLEDFASYVRHYNPGTVLVITYKGDSLGATSQLVKSIKETGGVVFKSDKIRDYQLRGPLIDYCKEKGAKIDEKSLSLLCEYIGSPLSKLFGEVDKLLVAAGAEGVISPQLIEDIIGISKEYNAFELVSAIARRNYPKTMKIIDHFSRNPKQAPGVVITATLFNYFSKLFIVSIMKDKSDSAVMEALDLKTTYALTDYRDGLRNYKAGMIDSIIHAIRSEDVMSKGVGSTQNEYALLKELMFKIFTLR